MRRFRLIVVPYELGRLRDGVGRGPEHLLAAGAEAALADAGAEVRMEVVRLEPSFNRSGKGDVDASFELIRAVAARAREACAEGAVPVVLSGSCFVAVGVVAGLGQPPPAVAWLDAHADYNTPETSLEGYFDGMGLAVLTGGAWQALLAEVPGAVPLPEQAVVLAGARDFDAPEERRLRASSIEHLTAGELRDPAALTRAVHSLRASVTGLYLHLDLDVLDLSVARVNVFGAPGGLMDDELQRVVEAVCANCNLRAVTLSAYDPTLDGDERVPPIALRVLKTIGSAAWETTERR
jgi:arginase